MRQNKAVPPDRGVELLLRRLQIAPEHSHAHVALGIAYPKLGDLPQAREYTTQALAADPRDPQMVYGLAFAYMEMGDIEQAQRHFQMVLDMLAPEDLRDLAKNGLREIAVRGLKAREPRMDAMPCGFFAASRWRSSDKPPSRSAWSGH